MILCSVCCKEMKCIKSGVSVIYNGGYHVYSGDKFACVCGNTVVVTNPTPWNPRTPIKPQEHDICMS